MSQCRHHYKDFKIECIAVTLFLPCCKSLQTRDLKNIYYSYNEHPEKRLFECYRVVSTALLPTCLEVRQ